jgi:hypothetical protein
LRSRVHAHVYDGVARILALGTELVELEDKAGSHEGVECSSVEHLVSLQMGSIGSGLHQGKTHWQASLASPGQMLKQHMTPFTIVDDLLLGWLIGKQTGSVSSRDVADDELGVSDKITSKQPIIRDVATNIDWWLLRVE